MTTLPPAIADLAQTVNVPFVNPLNQVTQYQEAGFACVATWLQSLGGVIEASSDSVVAGLGNFIINDSNIVHDIQGNAHSWVQVLIGTMRLVFDFVAPAGPFPQLVDVFRCTSTYNNDGTITNRPTPTNADTESAVIAWNLIGWGAPVGGSISYQWSAAQSIGWFWTKQASNNNTASFLVIERAAAADDYYDGIRDWFFMAGADPLNLTGRIAAYDGTAGEGILDLSVASAAASAWTFGLACDLRPRLFPIKYKSSQVQPEDKRVGGYSQLLMRPAGQTPFNTTDPADPPADLWSWRVLGIGVAAVLWLKSDGVIQ